MGRPMTCLRPAMVIRRFSNNVWITPAQLTPRISCISGWVTGCYINLPYYPVLKINNVTEYWGASGPQILSEQIPTNQSSGGQVYQLDAIHGQVIRAFMGLLGRPWFPGLSRILHDQRRHRA